MTESLPLNQNEREPVLSDGKKFEAFLAQGLEKISASKRLGEAYLKLIEILNTSEYNRQPDSSGSVYDERGTISAELTDSTAVSATVLIDSENRNVSGTEQYLESAEGLMLEFSTWEKPFDSSNNEDIEDPVTTLPIFISTTPPIQDFESVLGESHLSARYEDGSYVNDEELEYIIAALEAISSKEAGL